MESAKTEEPGIYIIFYFLFSTCVGMGYMAALSRFFAVVGVPANNTHAANQSLGILPVVCRWRGRQQRQGKLGDNQYYIHCANGFVCSPIFFNTFCFN